MAPLATTSLLLGLAAFSAASPLNRRQDELQTANFTLTLNEAAESAETDPTTIVTDEVGETEPTPAPTEVEQSTTSSFVVSTLSSSLATPIIDGVIQPEGVTDVEKWCKTINLNDAESVIALWEDEGVGNYLDIWTSMLPNGGDDWVYNLTAEVDGQQGDAGIRGCGTIGGACDPDIDCEKWVGELGQPQAYWALRAVAGLQSKLDAAFNFLVADTIETFLGISKMTEEFSAPESDNGLEVFAGLISSSLFVVGGVAGLVSVGASYAGAAAMSGAGAAQAAINTANKRHQFAGKKQAEALKASSEAKADRIAANGRASGAMGGATYLLGSTFSTISASTDPDNQVSAGVLEESLLDLFSDARDRLEEIGKLATGQGGDYSLLPHQVGDGGIIGEDSYIAGFFSNGRMLFGESNEVFQQALDATFGQFKTKIVDVALQNGGFIVMSPEHIDNGEDCGSDSWGGYGSQFVDLGDGNSRCMMLYRDATHCSTLTSCDYTPVDGEYIDLLQNKYGFNMYEYYKALYQCNKADREGDQPDLFDLPEGDELPACFYNLKAQSLKITNSCKNSRCETFEKSMQLSDF